jgi:endonuclease/exonuclease/phosphatase family metal-dependent hydrolase
MDATTAHRVSGLRPLASHATFPVGTPREQLDHVLVDGDLAAHASGAVPLPVSDHLALYVDLA